MVPVTLMGSQEQTFPNQRRICAVLDVYDALIHARVYRQALPEEEALAIMTGKPGLSF